MLFAGTPTAKCHGCFAPASAESEEGTDGKFWQTSTGDRLFLFESVSPAADNRAWDFLTGRKKAGVRLADAYQRMHRRCVDEGSHALVRRVRPHSSAVATAMLAVQKRFRNGTYEWDPMLMMDAANSEPFVATTDSEVTREEILATRKRAFCSQLAAEVLITAKLMRKERPARTYSPADFAPGGSVERELFAYSGHTLSEPVEVVF
jgi:hypothetical protein